MRGKKGHNKLKPAKVKFFADHAGIVDTQELVLGGGHVDEIGLAFGPFFVQELVYRLVSGGLEQIGADDLVKCLAQVGRTPLGGRIALGNVLAGLVHRRINAGKTYNGAAAVVMISFVLLFLGRVVICPMLSMYRSAALESLK